MRIILTLLVLLGSQLVVLGQSASVAGSIFSDGKPLESATVSIKGLNIGVLSTENGDFKINNVPAGKRTLQVSLVGYSPFLISIDVKSGENNLGIVQMKTSENTLDEVVISGTMKEVSRLDSPVPVEVFTAKFFKSNPTPSVFDALANVNGVRPQVNCSVCNTGDIHINGLEGPYTMVLIDGMPIVSGLSTVYGLSGIPQSLIERMEVVKGPASTLYGSEAVG
jgi:outer membrane receptor for ferrienterochelin and colicins